MKAASGIRAMIAATYGPSTDIISHVAARGTQKARIVRVRHHAPSILPHADHRRADRVRAVVDAVPAVRVAARAGIFVRAARNILLYNPCRDAAVTP